MPYEQSLRLFIRVPCLDFKYGKRRELVQGRNERTRWIRPCHLFGDETTRVSVKDHNLDESI